MPNAQPLSSHLARLLDELITRELEVYKSYLEVVEEERLRVVASKTAELADCTERREKLLAQMTDAQDQRFTLMRTQLGEPEMLGRRKAPPPSMRLSDFVRVHCAPSQAKILMPKVERLRKLVAEAHGKTTEFSQVLDFSLNLVSGLASILWSATKNIVTSYSSNATIKEQVHDPRSRKSGTLREA